MSQNLARLNERLIRDAYGSVAAEIVCVLMRIGRLTAREIAKHTGLLGSTVVRTLVTLVHMRYVLHWSDAATNTTWYSADPFNIYAMLWSGRIVGLYSEKHVCKNPGMATQLLEKFVVESHLRVADMHTEWNKKGIEKDAMATLAELVQNKVVTRLQESEFWPLEDRQSRYVADQFHTMPTEKVLALSEAARKTQRLVMVQDFENEANDARKNVSKLLLTASAAGTLAVADDAVLHINHHSFLISERRCELVALAARAVGPITARVYEKVLIASERSLYDIHQRRVPASDTNVTTNEIVKLVLSGPEGGEELTKLEEVFMNPSKKHEIKVEEEPFSKRQKTANGSANGSNGDTRVTTTASPELLEPVSETPAEIVNKHLRLLSGCTSIRFVMEVGDRGNGEWFVPFTEVVEDLRRVVFDELVRDVFGTSAARLVHIVRERGKIDEKSLSQVALIQLREIRHIVNNLHHYGFVDLQEVPRGNDRAPGRNFYFWYHRAPQAYARLVDQLYESILRTSDVIRDLRIKNETLLSKINREDVRLNLDKYLTHAEKDELHEFKEAEKTQVMSQLTADRYVRLFRDY